VVVVDDSVARRHAEVVIGDDDRFYLTDCGTRSGTWRLVGTRDGDDVWEKVRQGFVGPDEVVRLGNHRCTLGGLLADALAGAPSDGQGSARVEDRQAGSEHPRGPVERDPHTGEIVRKRL